MNLSKEEEEERLIKTCIKLHGIFFTFKPSKDGITNIYSIEEVNDGRDLRIRVNGKVDGVYSSSRLEEAIYRFLTLLGS